MARRLPVTFQNIFWNFLDFRRGSSELKKEIVPKSLYTQKATQKPVIVDVDFNLPPACVSDPSPYAPFVFFAPCSETVAGYHMEIA
jgi:hypothetical protein